MEVHEIHIVLLNILVILLMFVTLQLPPPDENLFPLQHRLFENFYGTVLRSRCVFPDIPTSPVVLEKHW